MLLFLISLLRKVTSSVQLFSLLFTTKSVCIYIPRMLIKSLEDTATYYIYNKRPIL